MECAVRIVPVHTRQSCTEQGTWRLQSVVSSGVMFPGWTSPNGIDTEPGTLHPTSVFLFRGLYSVWNQTIQRAAYSDLNIAGFVEGYINVQVLI